MALPKKFKAKAKPAVSAKPTEPLAKPLQKFPVKNTTGTTKKPLVQQPKTYAQNPANPNQPQQSPIQRAGPIPQVVNPTQNQQRQQATPGQQMANQLQMTTPMVGQMPRGAPQQPQTTTPPQQPQGQAPTQTPGQTPTGPRFVQPSLKPQGASKPIQQQPPTTPPVSAPTPTDAWGRPMQGPGSGQPIPNQPFGGPYNNLQPPTMTPWQQNLGPDVNQYMQTATGDIQAGYQASVADQQRATALGQQIQADTGHLMDSITGAQNSAMAQLNASTSGMNQTWKAAEGLPAQVTQNYAGILSGFNAATSAQFANLQNRADSELGQIYDSQTQAIQSVTQGIHGQLNQQLSEIDANPNLTPEQKVQMKSQSRYGGATALASAVGQTMQGYTQLHATTATNMNNILEAAGANITSGRTQLGTQFESDFAASSKAVSDIKNTISNLRLNQGQAMASNLATMQGLKSQAQMGGDQAMLNLLPSENTPFAMYSSALYNDYAMRADMLSRMSGESLRYYGYDMQLLAGQQTTQMGWADLAMAALDFRR